jgi:small subunit ribosomal protein S15
MLTAKKKANIIAKTQIHDTDTGSADVQIGILSKRIDELAAHLKKNQKDNHSRRGLLQMVADRRVHLKYLKKSDAKRYAKVVKELGLKSE